MALDESDSTKRACSRCREVKPLTSEHFHRDKRDGAGFHWYCRECATAHHREWYQANKERRLKAARAYHEANKERVLQYWRDWYAENGRIYDLEERRMRSVQRRARKVAAGGSCTARDIRDMYDSQERKCCYCLVDISSGFHIEHMTPLCRGGSDGWENVALSCKPCNRQKYNKTALEFLAVLGHTIVE